LKYYTHENSITYMLRGMRGGGGPPA